MIFQNSRYWTRPDKFYDRPGLWKPNISAAVPGYIGDKRNKLPGGFMRFKRWHKRPLSAWKLYWKLHK